MNELARVTTLEEIVEVATVRRKLLGLPQLEVDARAGLQDGYTAKLECRVKGLGKLSLPCLLGALKLELVVMPTSSGHRDKTGLHDDFFSRRARKAVAARYAKQTPKQRKKAARAAAKARWRQDRERKSKDQG